MICPECGAEYREGFARCRSCDVDLVEPPPPAVEEEPGRRDPEPDIRLVKVFETGNAAIIAVVESVFDDASIPFMKKGDEIQDMLGWGRFGAGVNQLTGPVQFWVREDDFEEAAKLIAALEEPLPDSDETRE